MKKTLLFFFYIWFAFTAFGQRQLKPQKVKITLNCNEIQPETLIGYLKSINLKEFNYKVQNNSVTWSAIVDLDSNQMQTIYANKLLFTMYPLVPLPEPMPIYTSHTLDEDFVNQVVVSEYILEQNIEMLCGDWKNEYISMEDTVYKYYLYDCSNNSLIDTTDINGIMIGLSPEKMTTIEIRFSKQGQQRFYETSRKYNNKQLVFKISDYIFSAPTVFEPINQPAIWITGNFDDEINRFITYLLLNPYKNSITITSISIE